ncbi:MAG: SurA N-terminal domain-containing protein [Erythrobacter sp.]
MLSLFRSFFQSKIGLPLFIGFLVLMAFAFAAADITGSTFGGLSADSRVALVGKEPIPASDVSTGAQVALEQVRAQFDPTITMPEFIEQDGLDEVVKQLIDRYAIGAYAQKYGLRAWQKPDRQRNPQDPRLSRGDRRFRSECLSGRLAPARDYRCDLAARSA